MNVAVTSTLAAAPVAGGVGLTVQDVSKAFQHPALAQVSLEVAPGELLAVTGPSGAGKTTLCRIIAGLERPDTGALSLAGKDLMPVPAGRRRVAFMFESYALYPHLTVRDNVRSPLLAAGGRAAANSPAARQRVDEVLELLEIAHLHDRLPGAMSGGQKQRVALARALVQQPSLYLLDEPISHLDAKLRHKLRGEIRRLSAQAAPTIWTTPDGMEAMSVGDRVAVIADGRIEQVGSPEEIWTRPATLQVARLLGDPPMNLVPGKLQSENGSVVFVYKHNALALSDVLARAANAATGHDVTLGVRPDRLTLADAETAGAFVAEVYANEPFGKHAIVTVDLGDLLIKLKTTMDDAARFAGTIGGRVGIQFPPEGLILFDGATSRALADTKP